MFIRQLPLTLLFLFIFLSSQVYGATKIVIAENGAGQGLIEHTLPAVALAATKNVDYLEIHVVMTADDELLVYRDLTLNRLSNIADVFPERSREDGNYYVIDFTLSEIRQLRLRNVFDTGPSSLSLGIPTLKEELSLIRKLEALLNKQIGVALEIENPRFHTNGGKDITNATLNTLVLFGYTSLDSKLYLQCFDPDELQRIHDQLLPEKKMRLPLIQLIAQNDELETKQQLETRKPHNYDWMFTNIGLRMLASYATAIALPTSAIVDQNGTLLINKYIDEAHRYGLKVLAYSVTINKEQRPSFVTDFSELLQFYDTKTNIDGLYTDSFVEVLQHNEQLAALKKYRAGLPTFFSSQELSNPNIEPQQQDIQ
ncbi:MAG: glycerophosphodiester phosphodiesterase [Desulfobulbaceae bacterium]|nr:glycerophosphodiester phosphodiesterase [Desulfobulbaceae bacterium]